MEKNLVWKVKRATLAQAGTGARTIRHYRILLQVRQHGKLTIGFPIYQVSTADPAPIRTGTNALQCRNAQIGWLKQMIKRQKKCNEERFVVGDLVL